LRYYTNIGAAPNVQYNWETDELSLPIGMGFDTMGKFGKLPFKYGAEIHYYAVQNDDFGPQWRLRLYFVPVLAAPGGSKKALFSRPLTGQRFRLNIILRLLPPSPQR
jgi:hypothetical protein